MGVLNSFHETALIQTKNRVRVERPQKNDVKRCYCYDSKQQQQQGETDDGSCGVNIRSEGVKANITQMRKEKHY